MLTSSYSIFYLLLIFFVVLVILVVVITGKFIFKKVLLLFKYTTNYTKYQENKNAHTHKNTNISVIFILWFIMFKNKYKRIKQGFNLYVSNKIIKSNEISKISE